MNKTICGFFMTTPLSASLFPVYHSLLSKFNTFVSNAKESGPVICLFPDSFQLFRFRRAPAFHNAVISDVVICRPHHYNEVSERAKNGIRQKLYGAFIVFSLPIDKLKIRRRKYMDCAKTGKLIYSLRKEQALTQRQLADRMNISDKAISKWERGLGCPDVSLLPELSKILGVNLGALLSGELSANDLVGGNMKKLRFYVCPNCGNLLTATADATVSCCGKSLQPLIPQKAEEGEKLSVEPIENDYFISTDHEMTREHHITFVALLTGDSIMLRKQYPEWNVQTRIPCFAHGTLVWYCSRHGLFYQPV
jgi:DNA-binding XRE family transcriptional regulator/desulfoferrodoxin (superoxide reductase-like protein)